MMLNAFKGKMSSHPWGGGAHWSFGPYSPSVKRSMSLLYSLLSGKAIDFSLNNQKDVRQV
jgi:hypothetical protein